jgi:hypothetical protein
MSFTPGRPTIIQFMKEAIEALPEVSALGPGHVWNDQAPAGTEGIIIVIQQIGPGRGVAPIGGRIIAANYRFQWRVGHSKNSMVGLVPIAKAIHARFEHVRSEVGPNGEDISMNTVVTDLPPIPVDDSGRPMQELGGEVEVFVNFGVTP